MVGSFRIRISRELGCALPVCWDTVVGVVISDLYDLSVCVWALVFKGTGNSIHLFSTLHFVPLLSLGMIYLFLIPDCPQINLDHAHTAAFFIHKKEMSLLCNNSLVMSHCVVPPTSVSTFSVHTCSDSSFVPDCDSVLPHRGHTTLWFADFSLFVYIYSFWDLVKFFTAFFTVA